VIITTVFLFTFFMLIFVTGDNFVQMFVGWEGIGLCFYLLINFLALLSFISFRYYDSSNYFARNFFCWY
jgi:NADH:ubiquinone oxidoreductase subunit 5 (subunit L)/multisubunit Na+/H+ antiporter MnhA subunit